MRAVLFDLDGTLVDSRVPFSRCVNAALRAHGLPERPPEELHRFLGPPLHATFRTLAGPGVPETTVDTLVDAYRARYRARADVESVVFDGIPELLGALAAADRPRVVVTSKPRDLAVPLLRALGLLDRFDAVHGPALDEPAEPKRVTLARALDGDGVGGDAIMVGDRVYDIEAAAAHGLTSIGVLWGLGPRDELEAADHLAGSPEELRRLLGA